MYANHNDSRTRSSQRQWYTLTRGWRRYCKKLEQTLDKNTQSQWNLPWVKVLNSKNSTKDNPTKSHRIRCNPYVWTSSVYFIHCTVTVPKNWCNNQSQSWTNNTHGQWVIEMLVKHQYLLKTQIHFNIPFVNISGTTKTRLSNTNFIGK